VEDLVIRMVELNGCVGVLSDENQVWVEDGLTVCLVVRSGPLLLWVVCFALERVGAPYFFGGGFEYVGICDGLFGSLCR